MEMAIRQQKIGVNYFEDEEIYAKSFISKIKEEYNGNLEYRHFLRVKELDSKVIKPKEIHIIDINLSETGEGEYGGIDAIKEVEKMDPLGIIIYSAYTEKTIKDRLKKQGITNLDYKFRQKRRLVQDVTTIGEMINDYIQEEPIINFKYSDVRLIEDKELNELKITSKNFEIDHLTLTSKVFFCKGLLNPNLELYHYLNLDDPLMDIHQRTLSPVEATLLEIDENLSIRHIVDEDSRELEGIILSRSEKILVALLTTNKDALVELIHQFNNKGKSLRGFTSYLVLFYIYNRIIDQFEIDDLTEEPIIADFLSDNSLDHLNLLKIGFYTVLWERLTLHETGEIEETNKLLSNSVFENFPIIENIFYCKVEEHESDGTAIVKLLAIEERDSPFYEYFDLEYLAEAGISNKSATFRYILFKNRNSGETLADRFQTIEPILQEEFKYILEQP